MAKESITLDPVEVATEDRSELELHAEDGSILVRFEGIDWPVFDPELFMVQGNVGESAIDSRLPNRTVSIPLMIGVDQSTFAQARQVLQAKVARINEEGGWMRRTLKSGEKVFGDVQKATLKLGGDTAAALEEIDANAELTLEISEFYGEEEESEEVESENGEAIFTVDDVGGNLPARSAIVVEDIDNVNHLGMKYGIRSRHYSAEATAALSYPAIALDPLDAAAEVSLTGALGGKAIRHNSLGTNWTPVLGTGFLTHTGTYRVAARVYSTSDSPPEGRFAYDIGDLVAGSVNDGVAVPGVSNFYEIDFGEARLDANPVGAHRWMGAFQFRGENGGENIYIDRVRFWPVDEGYGVLAAPVSTDLILSGYTVRDNFNQSAGALAGQGVETGGGNWAGAGDTDDFNVHATSHQARRLVESADSGTGLVGRGAIGGTSVLTGVAVQIDAVTGDALTAGVQAGYAGLLARYTDPSNYLLAKVLLSTGELVLVKRIAGESTTLATTMVSIPPADWITARLQVTTGGTATVWVYQRGTISAAAAIAAKDTALATGGSLASGKVGFYDESDPVISGGQRRYDNFAAWVPDSNAVVFSGRSVELRHDGCYRASEDGEGFGKVEPIGDLPRLPVSGEEERPIEIMVATSAGDFNEIPDSALQDFSVLTRARPSLLYVP